MDRKEEMRQSDSEELMAPMQPMRSTFHVDIPFTILFKEWNVDSTTGVIVSCLLLLVLSFFYECIKRVRSHINSIVAGLVEESGAKLRTMTEGKLKLVQTQNGCHCTVPDADKKSLTVTSLVKIQRSKLASAKEFLKSSKLLLHFISCFLYGFEIVISFGLMLSVMSFHTGVLTSVIIGGMFGKFILTWPGRLRISNDEEEHCH